MSIVVLSPVISVCSAHREAEMFSDPAQYFIGHALFGADRFYVIHFNNKTPQETGLTYYRSSVLLLSIVRPEVVISSN